MIDELTPLPGIIAGAKVVGNTFVRGLVNDGVAYFTCTGTVRKDHAGYPVTVGCLTQPL